jgi:hypothetical protein
MADKRDIAQSAAEQRTKWENLRALLDQLSPSQVSALAEEARSRLRPAIDESERQARTARLVAHLEEVWGKDCECPYCKNIKWAVDPEPVQISRFKRDGVVPAFMVTCATCGQTALVLAEAADIPVSDP